MEPESADHHAVKRRRRPAKSCDACRARKVRCDQKMPCGPCRKARSAPKCIYGADTIRLPSPDPTPEETGPHVSAFSTPRDPDGEQSADTDQLKRQIAQLRSRVDTLESKFEASTAWPSSVSPSDLRVKPIAPKLRQVADKNKLFGANHWIHTAKFLHAGSIGTKDVELTFETPKIDFAKIRQDMTKLRLTIKQFEMPILNDPVPDLIATLPSREECDVLVDIYLSTHERIYRVLHRPTFAQYYDAFWQDPAASSTPFRMTLILILALGTTLRDDAGECALASRKVRTWLYAAQWWLTGPTEKTTFTLEGMQVACLLQLARQMTVVGRAWASSGTLLQMAFATGLHRDPGHFPAMAPRQAQLQRQLWATVRELSLLSAMDSPMQAYVDLAACDTKPPENIDDVDVGTNAEVPGCSRPDEEMTDASLQRLLCKSFSSRLQAAKLIHGSGDIVYADAISLANTLKAACSELSQFFDTHSESPLLNGFHSGFLDIHFRLHILRLHRQFLLQKSDETSCFLSRKVCFDAATVIASYASHNTSPDVHLRRLSRLFLSTTGAMRAPFSLEIITMLGLELRMQLVDDDTHGRGPAGALARAAREPIFETLARIRGEFLRRIEHGSPQCKPYGLAMSILAQLRAVERRENPEQALSDAVTDNLAEVTRYMEGTVDRLTASGDAGVGDLDLDALLAMDFNRYGGGLNFGGFGMEDEMWQ